MILSNNTICCDDGGSVSTLQSTGLSLQQGKKKVHQDEPKHQSSLSSSTSSSSLKNGNEQQQQQQQEEPNKKESLSLLFQQGPKKVRFAEPVEPKIVWIPSCREMKPQDVQRLWYDHADFDRFKYCARVFAKKVRLEGPAATLAVEQAYPHCRHLAQNLTKEVEDQDFDWTEDRFWQRGDNHHHLNDEQCVASLLVWARREPTCRGLEHWIGKAYSAGRQEAKTELQHAMAVARWYGTEEKSRVSKKSLSSMAQEISRPSRILARFLGMADAQFQINSQQEQEDELSQQILRDYELRIRWNKQQKDELLLCDAEKEETVKVATGGSPSSVAVVTCDLPEALRTFSLSPRVPAPRRNRTMIDGSARPSRQRIRTSGMA